MAPASPLGARVRSWRSDQIDPAGCVFEFDARERNELAAMCEQIRMTPLPVLLRHADHFDIPRLRRLMAKAKRALEDGIGVVVLDRLSLDEIDHETALAVSWSLGTLIGRNVAQKWDGTMLYDVTDKGLTSTITTSRTTAVRFGILPTRSTSGTW